MSTVLGWFLAFVIILGLAGYFFNQMAKAKHRLEGRCNCRCRGSRLKSPARGFGDADHCGKRGRARPWAASE